MGKEKGAVPPGLAILTPKSPTFWRRTHALHSPLSRGRAFPGTSGGNADHVRRSATGRWQEGIKEGIKGTSYDLVVKRGRSPTSHGDTKILLVSPLST
jgi:hypothetical protein